MFKARLYGMTDFGYVLNNLEKQKMVILWALYAAHFGWPFFVSLNYGKITIF